jgi:hypothetical protein
MSIANSFHKYETKQLENVSDKEKILIYKKPF